MRTLAKLFVIMLGVALLACQSDELSPSVDPTDTQLSFRIQRINSEKNFSSIAREITFNRKSSWWWQGDTDRITVMREVIFDVKLANGEIVELGFSFLKNGLKEDQLILKDHHVAYGERDWDFKSFEDEANNFYRDFEGASVYVNPTNVIFHNQSNDDFVVTNVEPVMVDGVERSLVTIKFKGNATGWYDPSGEFYQSYKLSSGYFQGIIE